MRRARTSVTCRKCPSAMGSPTRSTGIGRRGGCKRRARGRMIETLLVLGVVGLLVLLGTGAYVMSVEALLIAGGACVALGFAIGLPAGTLYHLKLYRCL